MLLDKFLVCNNCVRWGLPWKLQHKLVVCHERKDPSGTTYHPDHTACRYFMPKRQMPEDLQTLRLLIQSLSPTQVSFLTFAADQASKLLNAEDCEGSPLAMGDLVFFTKTDMEHYGTVEGLQGKDICVWSPAFPNETTLLDSKAIRRANRKDLSRLLDTQLAQDERWNLTPDYLREISKLRSLSTLTEEQRQTLLEHEEQYALMTSEDKYLAALLALRSKLK